MRYLILSAVGVVMSLNATCYNSDCGNYTTYTEGVKSYKNIEYVSTDNKGNKYIKVERVENFVPVRKVIHAPLIIEEPVMYTYYGNGAGYETNNHVVGY